MNWSVSGTNGDWGVQGDPANNNYFVQSQRYQAWADAAWLDGDKQANDKIAYYADKYSDWEEMHKMSVVWFDTAGCFDTNNFFSSTLWGDVN